MFNSGRSTAFNIRRLKLLPVHLILPAMTTCYNQVRCVSQIHVNIWQCSLVIRSYDFVTGMADIGILVCNEQKCEAELGKAITIKVSGIIRKAGIWDIEKIRLVSGQ